MSEIFLNRDAKFPRWFTNEYLKEILEQPNKKKKQRNCAVHLFLSPMLCMQIISTLYSQLVIYFDYNQQIVLKGNKHKKGQAEPVVEQKIHKHN